MVCCGVIWHGMVWYSKIWYDMGMVRYAMAYLQGGMIVRWENNIYSN